jgi:hypothetical protein
VAARFKPKAYTLTSTAAVSLSTILASPNDDYVGSITVRAAKANVGDVFWGDGTALGGYLQPKEAASFDLAGKFVSCKDIYFNGTQGDSIYITVIG